MPDGENTSPRGFLGSRWGILAMGALIGLINGLLGAGGGMVAVPLLEKMGLDTKKAHATSIALIWPLCLMSGALYWLSGYVDWGTAGPYLLPGLAGAVAGGLLLKKMAPLLLRRIFGVVLIASALKMLLR